MGFNLVFPKFRTEDSDGNPLEGGKVHTYEIGTTTDKTTYTDILRTVANENPVILDSRGEADIFFDGKLKIVIKDLDDVTIDTIDNLERSLSPSETTVVVGSFDLSSNTTGIYTFDLSTDYDRFICSYSYEAASSTPSITTSTDGGLTYDSSSYHYRSRNQTATTTETITGANNQATLAFATAAAVNHSGTFSIGQPDLASMPASFHGNHVAHNGTTGITTNDWYGHHGADEAVDNFKFTLGDTPTTGFITLWGMV